MDMPILGICRGLQLINVACGGNLYQDLTYYIKDTFKHVQSAAQDEVSHKIDIEKGSKLYELFGLELMVNSYHHQSEILLNIMNPSKQNGLH